MTTAAFHLVVPGNYTDENPSPRGYTGSTYCGHSTYTAAERAARGAPSIAVASSPQAATCKACLSAWRGPRRS